MRIAFFLHAFPELSETFILRQITALLNRGHTVTIFTDGRPNSGVVHEDVAKHDLMKRIRLLHAEPALPGSLRRRAAAVAGLPVLLRRPWLSARYLAAPSLEPLSLRLRHLRALRRLAAEPRHDIVHCHFGDIGLRYRFAARLWRAPLIVSFYGFDCSIHPRARWRERYRPLTRAVAGVTVLSRHMAGRVTGFGFPADRIRIVPLCVDPRAWAAPAEPGGQPIRIVTVARLSEKKGLEYGLQAFAQVAPRFPDVHYDVIGDGPLRAELLRLVDRLGLTPRVTFHGAQNETFVRAAMQRSQLFLLPSVTARNGDEEGTPTVLLEAASCGLPVVSTRHTGIPEVVLDGRTGLLVEERDVDGLAAAISRLLADPELRAALGREGRSHVAERHDCERIGAELERLYAEVIG